MFRRKVAIGVAVVSLIAGACGASGSSAAPGSSAGRSLGPSVSSTASVAGATASPSAVGAFRVVGVEVTADPAHPSAACPIEIVFNSRNTVAGGSGTVKFRWVSSDGDVSQVASKNFSGPGSYEHSTSWTVNESDVPSGAGWSSIEILDPIGLGNVAASSHADFTFTCDDSGIDTLGFGIGGSDADCSIAKLARSFATTDLVRMVATWSPSLRAGTALTYALSRDGVVVHGYPITVTYDVSTKCTHGNVSPGGKPLPVGTYRLEITSDTARGVSGEFDVK